LAKIGNVIYALLFGWIIAAAYLVAAGILWLSQVGKPYAHMCRKLAGYYLWPFGKYLTVGPTPSSPSAAPDAPKCRVKC
jgi:uncharacterized membrane protein YccF (DUF307 family)